MMTSTSNIENKDSALITEIKALGEPEKEPSGRLEFNYHKKLLTIVMKSGKQSFANEKEELIKKRRQLLKDEKMEEYKVLAAEIIQKEESVSSDVLKEAMDHIGLNEQEFMGTHQYYMMNPETQQELLQAQTGEPTNKVAPTLSLEKTKEIFFEYEEKKFESMKTMMQNQKGIMNSQEGQMKAMIEMTVQKAILAD